VFAAPLYFAATCLMCQAEISRCSQVLHVSVLILHLGASPS